MPNRILEKPIVRGWMTGGLAVLALLALLGGPLHSAVYAHSSGTPPPTPVLTVVQTGGDSHCRISISPGDPANPGPYTYSFSKAYSSGTVISLDALVQCPCDRYFYQWQSDTIGIASDLRRRDEFTMPSSNVTVTAVYHQLDPVIENGQFDSVYVGGEYGANVKYIYRNGYMLSGTEQVTPGNAAQPPFCECLSGPITQQPLSLQLVQCDEFGNDDPLGMYGYVIDLVRNLNGPPSILSQILQHAGNSLPCTTATEQLICLTNGCMEWEFPHTQNIYVYETPDSAPPSGYIRVYVSNVGSITKSWP